MRIRLLYPQLRRWRIMETLDGHFFTMPHQGPISLRIMSNNVNEETFNALFLLREAIPVID